MDPWEECMPPQARGPEFDPQCLSKELGMIVCTHLQPRVQEMEMRHYNWPSLNVSPGPGEKFCLKK